MSCDDLGPFPFTKKFLLTSILDKFDDLAVRMDQQQAEWTRRFDLLEIKGDRHMAEVTGLVQAKADAIAAAIEALRVRIEQKIADANDAMDAVEAAPILAGLDTMKTTLDGMFPAATGGGTTGGTDTGGGTTEGGFTGETAEDATEV